jgi:hypothetical protein
MPALIGGYGNRKLFISVVVAPLNTKSIYMWLEAIARLEGGLATTGVHPRMSLKKRIYCRLQTQVWLLLLYYMQENP